MQELVKQGKLDGVTADNYSYALSASRALADEAWNQQAAFTKEAADKEIRAALEKSSAGKDKKKLTMEKALELEDKLSRLCEKAT